MDTRVCNASEISLIFGDVRERFERGEKVNFYMQAHVHSGKFDFQSAIFDADEFEQYIKLAKYSGSKEKSFQVACGSTVYIFTVVLKLSEV